MAIVECKNGHIYDPDQSPSCPYCGKESNAIHFDESMEPAKTGRTVAPEGYRRRQDEQNRTVAVFQRNYHFEPVVGWLTCIEGAEKGKAYHLWARINTIGRGEGMDVCIPSDPTISKDTHARLAYDPKHNNFQLIPGMSTNNIYLNDDPVYVPVKLSAYDRIELGNTKLLFVPLCGERFQWDKEQDTEKRHEE